MTTVIVRHKVKSFDQWNAVFRGMTGARAQHGCKEERVYRSIEDPEFVVVRTEWGSPEQARGYFTSRALKEGMAKAGVAEAPTVDMLEESP
jgi:heme-degrading monooxygenase HmoA